MYSISVSPPRVAVTMDLRGVPSNGTTLAAVSDREVMRLTEVRVEDRHGAPRPFHISYRRVITRGVPVQVPTIVIPGPIRGPLIVRYGVSPDRRIGNEHLGYTGECHGVVSTRSAVITGRNLFLVPEGPFSARVEFVLPAGWSVEAPWERRGKTWVPGAHGLDTAEALVSATIGLGRFRDRSFEVSGTLYHFAFDDAISWSEERSALRDLERATRFVHGLFQRGPGPDYLTIVAPRTDLGDEIQGEGSAAGQGGTLMPLTAGRLRLYADRLISTFLLYAPTRTEIRDPREFWLVDAIRYWYSYRAVAHAGRVTSDDVIREILVGYGTTVPYANIDRNLERMYQEGDPSPVSRFVLAPASLVYIDHLLGPGPTHGLDHLLPRLFRGSHARPFWSSLPHVPGVDWDSTRAQYIGGRRRIPIQDLLRIQPTRPPPPGAAKGNVRLMIVYTGDGYGFLENCGCKVNQSGGVARRSWKISELRHSDPELLLLDAGNTFPRPKTSTLPDPFSRREQVLYLRTMDAMGYSAASIGPTELALGSNYFREMTRHVHTPFLVSNVLTSNGRLAAGSMIVPRHRLRIGIIGVLEPPRVTPGANVFESNTSDIVFADALEAVRAEVASLQPRVDLIVVVGNLDPYSIRRLVSECPQIDIVISNSSRAPMIRDVHGKPAFAVNDASGLLGGTLVLYTVARQYGVGVARLHIDATNRIRGFECDDLWLGEETGEDPHIRRMLDRFYSDVDQSEADQASVSGPFDGDASRRQGLYAGAGRCRECHQSEYDQWATTPHASAYKTLLDAHRHYQPRCVSCHVVGFGAPHGYKLGSADETLANVQCEVCHGPGANHADEPSTKNIERTVAERVCTECHNPEHSDDFIYSDKVRKVIHRTDSTPITLR
jgi:hypothetical protein